MPSLSSLIINNLYVLNTSGALLILTHETIQVVYCHYMLTPSMECLWCVKFWQLCLKEEDKLIEWKTKGQGMALRVNILQYNRFMFLKWTVILLRKNWTHTPSAVGLMAHWLADKMRVRVEILKILYRSNYSDFCYVLCQCYVIIALKTQFSWFFLSIAFYKVCFHVDPYY